MRYALAVPKPPFAKLHEAVRFAAVRHDGQDRDGAAPLPYLTHPMDVLARLRYVGGVTDEDALCAAALHDVVEEAGVEHKQIEKRFGARVADLVRQLTREEPEEKVARQLDKAALWRLRSDMLLEEIRTQMEPTAWAIKLADRLSNLSEALVTRSKDRLDRYLVQTTEILAIIPRDANPALWDALRREVDSALDGCR